MARRGNTRQKILEAAAELARTEGSAHLSLDSVAARAGISKGGLLYNFPTKSALLKALVQQHIDEFETVLNERLQAEDASTVSQEYFRLSLEHMRNAKPPPSGLLAALSEDPELLAPVRRFNRRLLDRMKSESSDPTALLMLFLALEGLRVQKLLGTDILTEKEHTNVLEKLDAMQIPTQDES